MTLVLAFDLNHPSEKNDAGSVGAVGSTVWGFASGRLLLVRDMDVEDERAMDGFKASPDS